MTVAIKRKNGDLIWFDAILNFNRVYAASVTKHTIEQGGKVTDHTTIENPTIQLNGVVSDADFNLTRPIISQFDADTYGITNKQFVNNSPVTSSPEISYSTSKYTKFLPEEAQKFLPQTSPTVVVPDAIKPMYSAYIDSLLTTMWGQKEEFELIDFVDNNIHRVFIQCIFTNVSFSEDPDSGMALYANLAIEQVRYVRSTNVKIPQRVQEKVKSKAAPVQNKGTQQGDTQSKVTQPGDDGQSPRDMSKWKEMTSKK